VTTIPVGHGLPESTRLGLDHAALIARVDRLEAAVAQLREVVATLVAADVSDLPPVRALPAPSTNRRRRAAAGE
jgi:hypothetical protein